MSDKVIIGDATLYHGDCMDILPTLGKVDAQAKLVEQEKRAIVSDPPYGMKWDGKVTAGKNGHDITGAKAKHYGVTIVNDEKPFNPAPFLDFDDCILFGANHFYSRLPVGTTLVWIKRLDGAFGSFLSDAEIAWQKGGHGVYCFRDQSLMAETRNRAHPTQKPVVLIEWCLKYYSKEGDKILDPTMGSGSTGVACKNMNRHFIGIEMDKKIYDVAVERLNL